MLYGQAKLYKTTTALCAPPEFRPMAFLDTDRGAKIRLALLTMSKAQRDSLGVAESIPEWIGPWITKDVDFFYPDARTYYEDCFEFATRVAADYKLVVLDSASRMADAFLKQVANTQYSGVSGETKRVRIGQGPSATVHATMSDYGFAQDRVMEIVTALNDGPAHTLLISHEKTTQFEEGDPPVVKRVVGGPRTTGKALVEVLPAIVDTAVRVEARKEPVKDAQGRLTGALKHLVVMRTRPHDFFLAGDRSGLFKDGEELNPKLFWEKVSALIKMAQSAPQGGTQS